MNISIDGDEIVADLDKVLQSAKLCDAQRPQYPLWQVITPKPFTLNPRRQYILSQPGILSASFGGH